MKKWVIFIFILLLLPLITGLEYRKQGNNISFVEIVRVNSAPSDSITAMITITDENNNIVVGYAPMTYDSTNKTFNYTLTDDKTGQNGLYKRCIDATAFGINQSKCFDFYINPTGIEPSDQRTESLSRTIYFIFAISIMLFIAFLFTTESTPVKWTFFVLCFLFFLIGTNFVFITLQDEVVNPKIEAFFSSFTAISFIMYWFIAGILIIIWAFTFMNTWIYTKNLKNARRYGIA